VLVAQHLSGRECLWCSRGGRFAQEGAYRQINVYGEVLQHVQSDYVEVPNIPAVTNGALRGLLESLDADSSYLTPADYKAYKADKGGKAQVGINVSKRFGYATIVSVVPGSPADKANLNDGDIIEAIGTQDTRDLSLAMIQLLLEGAPGSELHLAVIRTHKAEPDKITLNRVVVAEPPVTDTLYENSSILVPEADGAGQGPCEPGGGQAEGHEQEGTKKVLLDLRDVAAWRYAGGDPAGQLLSEVGHHCDALGAEVSAADVYG
jgi:carboxyl-terminal processing protease